MKFFARYITTGEEPQPGDKAVCTHTAKTWGSTEDENVELRTEGKIYDIVPIKIPERNYDSWGYVNNQGEHQYIHYSEEMEKVKLYLCSHDIHVGDRIKLKVNGTLLNGEMTDNHHHYEPGTVEANGIVFNVEEEPFVIIGELPISLNLENNTEILESQLNDIGLQLL